MRRFVTALFLAGSALANTSYSVVALGGYGGSWAAATSIAADGRTAGSALTAANTQIAFSEGVILGAQAEASDVNSSGSVVGTSMSSGSARATLWHNGVADEILGVESYGLGLNESGDVSGSRMSSGAMRAFVTSGGVVRDLPAGGLWSAAYDINSGGAATGTLLQSDWSFQAYAWDATSGTRTLGTLGGRSSYGQAINDFGAVAGASTTASGSLHAFAWDGSMHDLGTLGGVLSSAYDINAKGQVVGYSYDGLGRSRAFVWYEGVMVDLNSLVEPGLGWTFEAAYGINATGQIVGTGTWRGHVTAFRLDPESAVQRFAAAAPLDVVSTGAPVPEPAWLGVPGLILLFVGRWKKAGRSGRSSG